MAQPIIYRTPPIAGRPPYATDEPDFIYKQQPASPRRVMRQQAPPDPNARTSAYNVYDQYLDGAHNAQNPFDDTKAVPRQARIPLAAPQPGYAAPVAALNLSRPSPIATSEGRAPASPEMSQAQYPKPLTLVSQQSSPRSPTAIPSTPHPLQPPMTPIAPAFIRPSNSPIPRDVRFASPSPIMRGNSEETLLPKRGQQGEDFWRRFSIVAKEDNRKPSTQKESTWLKKTMSSTNRMSRFVFIGGVFMLLIIVGAICLKVYVGDKDTSNSAPVAIGGSADETGETTTVAAAEAVHHASSSSLHVTPTNTVARRSGSIELLSTSVPVAFALDDSGSVDLPRIPLRHRRSHLNRTLH